MLSSTRVQVTESLPETRYTTRQQNENQQRPNQLKDTKEPTEDYINVQQVGVVSRIKRHVGTATGKGYVVSWYG